MFPPSRIVCLTEETVETLYLLGEQDRIIGISGYVVRPPQARREKPRVSAFTSANIDKILALKPDLVLTFSDLQADIAVDLIRRGLDVHALNQRSVAGILDMIRMLGAMVDASERARQLVETLETRLAEVRSRAARLPKRQRGAAFLSRASQFLRADAVKKCENRRCYPLSGDIPVPRCR
jgi:iron complex transport system substrate-binding protein